MSATRHKLRLTVATLADLMGGIGAFLVLSALATSDPEGNGQALADLPFGMWLLIGLAGLVTAAGVGAFTNAMLRGRPTSRGGRR